MFESKARARIWGFRFSPSDAVAIGLFLSSAGALWHFGSPLGWLLVIAAGHFFLFCNVFRIARRRELIWAGLFLLNVTFWAWNESLTWTGVLLCQLPVTIALVLSDLRSAGYHGIFAKRLNPRLNDYLKGQEP